MLLTTLLFHCRLPDAQCKREGSQQQTKEKFAVIMLVSFICHLMFKTFNNACWLLSEKGITTRKCLFNYFKAEWF